MLETTTNYDGGPPPQALDIKGLEKTYPTGVEALKGVDLEIDDGEFFGLLGPNGAGKSTLIHCTTGLAQPTGGEIQVFGHDAVADYGPARQAVGLAPQELNLDWFLTCEETLDYHAGYFGMPKKERRERAAELLETFSLYAKRKERTRTLSRRDEAAADPRPRADAPPAPADPRRADRRRRHRAAARALALRAADQRGGDDDPAHHPLPRGGRAALRPDRLHQRGRDRRLRLGRRALDALRGRQPRGRLPGAGRAQGALALASLDVAAELDGGCSAMSTTQIRFFTLWRRELNRFMKIKKQTIGAPLLETFLYISVFGAALGSRIDTLHGFKYVVFVIPGLIMMAWAMNSFSNNASSILQQKFQGAIQDQLSSPASPLELLTAFSLGGFTRGLRRSRCSPSSPPRCSSTCRSSTS